MNISFRVMLNAKHNDEQEMKKCEEFKRYFTANKGKFPHIFNFSLEEIKDVKSYIEKKNPSVLVFYKILPDLNNLEEFPAYQIPMPGIDNLVTQQGVKLNKLKGVGIAKDFSTGAIIANKKFKELISPLCKGLKWEALNEDCFNLVGIQKLQEPIQVINALEIRENAKPPSTFTITGDGRKVIPNNALAKVYANGLIINDLSEANGEVFMTPNIFIVSTPIMQQLLEAKFKHISKHILPLLNADQVAELS